MDKTLKNAIGNIGTVYEVVTQNLQNYANNVIDNISKLEPTNSTDLSSNVALGWKTGNQGWYDKIGGGPCNTYCRYTGLSPNVQWTCSDSSDLTKLNVVPVDQSGRFCYAYDKISKNPEKDYVVVNGTLININDSNTINENNPDFIIYPNKNASGINDSTENFTNYNDKPIKCIYSPIKYSNYYPDLNKIYGYNNDQLKSHYLNYGIYEERTPCGDTQPNCFWDPEKYSQANPQIKQKLIDPLDHYKTYGINEGLSPCPNVKLFLSDKKDSKGTSTVSKKYMGSNKKDDFVENFNTLGDMTLSECENVCDNDDKCKGFSYNIKEKKCTISDKIIRPSGSNPNNISGNKKNQFNTSGMYNIYQNNSCINSTVFDSNPSIEKSLGIKTINGKPIISKTPTCSSNLNNNFIFTKSNEIIALDTYDFSTQGNEGNPDNSTCSYGSWNDNNWSWDWTCDGTSDNSTQQNQTIKDIKCLEHDPLNNIKKKYCDSSENQKWIYDNSTSTIKSWDGRCLNFSTKNSQVIPSLEPCDGNINQKFYLKPSQEYLQPTSPTILNSSSNLSTTNIKENYSNIDTCELDYFYQFYLTYLIILLLVLVVVIKK
jgi:hypothetical protein